VSERILSEPLDRLRDTRTGIKWRRYPADVLPMWVAEMDARACPAVVEAVSAAVGRGDCGYATAEEYAAAMAGFARHRWGWDFAPDTAFPVTDVMVGMAELLRSVTEPSGPVVISPPCYNAFYGFLDRLDRRVVTAPLTADGRLDGEALDRAFASVAGERAAYLLCNPQNPTGTVATAAELTELAALAERHHVQVIADEIHAPLTHPGVRFTPYLSVPGAEAGITLLSASKAWNVAGLKGALVVPGAAAGPIVAGLHEVITHAVSHVGVIGQTAALVDGVDWLDQLLDELVANERLLRELLAGELSAVRFPRPAATFFAWLDFSAITDRPAEVLLERGRVALTAGEEYGGAPGTARLNFATSPEVLAEGVRRMASALQPSAATR